jgi:hypothetical protein
MYLRHFVDAKEKGEQRRMNGEDRLYRSATIITAVTTIVHLAGNSDFTMMKAQSKNVKGKASFCTLRSPKW